MKHIDEKILSWCNNPEEGVLKQARNLAQLPCLVGNVCLMPDTHEGYGMPIGGVIALENAICPNAVGSDIGCGMLAVKTNLIKIPERSILEKIVETIRSQVPVGKNWHGTPIDSRFFYNWAWGFGNNLICRIEKDNAKLHDLLHKIS